MPRWVHVLQHATGIANAWILVSYAAEGAYGYAAASLLFVLLTATWGMK